MTTMTNATNECNCPERPKCQWQACESYAAWSVFNPFWRRIFPHGRFRFMCTQHEEMFRDAATKPMAGITKPSHADDEWRPSLMDHIRLSCAAMSANERMSKPPEERSAAPAQGFEFRNAHECSLAAVERWIKRGGYHSFLSGTVLVILRDGRHIASYAKGARTLYSNLGGEPRNHQHRL